MSTCGPGSAVSQSPSDYVHCPLWTETLDDSKGLWTAYPHHEKLALLLDRRRVMCAMPSRSSPRSPASAESSAVCSPTLRAAFAEAGVLHLLVGGYAVAFGGRVD